MKQMTIIKNKLLNGIVSLNFIVILALIAFTLDTIGEYSYLFKPALTYAVVCQKISRIAVPLVVFAAIEYAKCKEKRVKFLGQLYVAGLGYGLIFTVYNFIEYGDFSYGYIHGCDNVFFLLFYVVFYVHIIECFIDKYNDKDYKALKKYAVVFFIPILLMIFRFQGYDVLVKSISANSKIAGNIFENLYDSFFLTPIDITNGIYFLVIGVIMYFMKNKIYESIVFFVLCVISVGGAILGWNGTLYDSYQYYMVFAFPFMLLYNDKKNSINITKYLMFAYYPIQRILVIFTLGALAK